MLHTEPAPTGSSFQGKMPHGMWEVYQTRATVEGEVREYIGSAPLDLGGGKYKVDSVHKLGGEGASPYLWPKQRLGAFSVHLVEKILVRGIADYAGTV